MSVCDRCGFTFRPRKLRREWSGFMVCRPCYDPRPADTRAPRLGPEGLPHRNTNPEPPPVFRAPDELGGDDL